jgi:DNA-binding PadR family transcriptional regulator
MTERRMPLEAQRRRAAVLEAILVAGESYGLAISLYVKDHRGFTFRGGPYPLLRQMEREGLLTSREADATPERGNRPRTYYKLTPAGEAELRKLRGLS